MYNLRELIYDALKKEADDEIDGIEVWELYKENGECVWFDITTIDDINTDDPKLVLFTLVGDDEYGISYHVTVEIDVHKKKWLIGLMLINAKINLVVSEFLSIFVLSKLKIYASSNRTSSNMDNF